MNTSFVEEIEIFQINMWNIKWRNINKIEDDSLLLQVCEI